MRRNPNPSPDPDPNPNHNPNPNPNPDPNPNPSPNPNPNVVYTLQDKSDRASETLAKREGMCTNKANLQVALLQLTLTLNPNPNPNPSPSPSPNPNPSPKPSQAYSGGRDGFAAHAKTPHYARWAEFKATEPFSAPAKVGYYEVYLPDSLGA